MPLEVIAGWSNSLQCLIPIPAFLGQDSFSSPAPYSTLHLPHCISSANCCQRCLLAFQVCELLSQGLFLAHSVAPAPSTEPGKQQVLNQHIIVKCFQVLLKSVSDNHWCVTKYNGLKQQLCIVSHDSMGQEAAKGSAGQFFHSTQCCLGATTCIHSGAGRGWNIQESLFTRLILWCSWQLFFPHMASSHSLDQNTGF